jgi:hypothetical protein
MLKSEIWPVSLLVKAFSKYLEKKGLCVQRKNIQKLSNCFKTKSHQDSMIFTLIPVKFFFFQNTSKAGINNVKLQMEVTELQINDLLKNAFKPSDMRTFYSRLPSEVFPKLRKFKVGMMTVSSSTYLYLQANILFLNSRKTSLFHVNR